jgi:hypothetical protein
MDWKYKHFNHAAIFNASRDSVLEAARVVMAEALGGIAETTDGFVARGYSGWHAAVATIRIMPASSGTQVAVELLVERSALRSYMLVDVGGYYTGQIDKWFSGIARRLEGPQAQTLVSKTTSNVRVWQGCLAGCLVYLIVGAGLAIAAIPLDHALFPQPSGSMQGPFAVGASLIGLIAGVAVFLRRIRPEASAAPFTGKQLPTSQNNERPQ